MHRIHFFNRIYSEKKIAFLLHINNNSHIKSFRLDPHDKLTFYQKQRDINSTSLRDYEMKEAGAEEGEPKKWRKIKGRRKKEDREESEG